MQGPARGGLPRRSRELQPGDDHDRPGDGRPHLRRADDGGERREDHRPREARCAAADDRRPDRPQPGHRSCRGGGPRTSRGRADRRQTRCDPQGRGSRAVPRSDGADRLARAALRVRAFHRGGARAALANRAARDHPAVLHAGRRRLRRGLHRRGVRPHRALGPAAVAATPGAARAERPRLEGVRARGDARQRRQRRHHLLDRELRPDGCPHRRLDHRGAGADADRQGISGDALGGDRDHPRDRRRHRRFQHPVRRESERRRDGDHRDEPARLPLFGVGVEGDRIPDRQDRRETRGRLLPRRDPQRHHARDTGQLRADDRLRGHEDPALHVREVPAGGRHADDADEVGRGSDGDRADVQGEPAEGDPFARDRARRARESGDSRRRGASDRGAVRTDRRPEARPPLGVGGGAPPRCDGRGAPSALVDRSVVPAQSPGTRRRGGGARGGLAGGPAPLAAARQADGLLGSAPGEALGQQRARGPRAPPRSRRPSGLQARRYLRRRVPGPYAVSLLDLRGRVRGQAHRSPQDHHPRRRSEPDRPGDRVRLLLRPCSLRAARCRLRDDHDQLQPGDRLDRLRHGRPALLRAAHARGRARDRRQGAARRRDRAVRRADAAAAGCAARTRRRTDPRDVAGRDRSRRGSRALRGAAREARPGPSAVGHGAQQRRSRARRRADRLSRAGPALLRARGPRDDDRPRCPGAA